MAQVGGGGGDGGGFDGGAVADADEAEDGGVAFGDAEDVVVEVGAGCACGGGLGGGLGWKRSGEVDEPHISRCLRSSRSRTLKVAFFVSWLCSRLMYGGSCNVIFPALSSAVDCFGNRILHTQWSLHLHCLRKLHSCNGLITLRRGLKYS